MSERRWGEEPGHLGRSKLIRQRRISIFIQSVKFRNAPSEGTLMTGHFIDL